MQHLPGVDEVKRQSATNDGSKEIERLCEWRLQHDGPGDIEVFLRIGVSTTDTEAVRAALEQSAAVRSFRYLDHDDALREFREIFADKPKLLRDTTADQLPTSFRVDVALGPRATQLIEQLADLPAVDEVVERSDASQCRAAPRRSLVGLAWTARSESFSCDFSVLWRR